MCSVEKVWLFPGSPPPGGVFHQRLDSILEKKGPSQEDFKLLSPVGNC